jgi:hypothetical protein
VILSDEQDSVSGSNSLIKRLFRRHVIQTAAIYVAVTWGAVEILLTLTERLGWPDWINTVALAIFVAGFPVVIILSRDPGLEGLHGHPRFEAVVDAIQKRIDSDRAQLEKSGDNLPPCVTNQRPKLN